MLKRLILIAAILLPTGVALAQEERLSAAACRTDIKDIQSLQRGARDFMNYCSGCHSLEYLRYNRMATDLRIPLAVLAANLMFTSKKPYRRDRLGNAGDRRWPGSGSSPRI